MQLVIEVDSRLFLPVKNHKTIHDYVKWLGRQELKIVTKIFENIT